MFGAQVLQLKHSNTNEVVLQKMVNALMLKNGLWRSTSGCLPLQLGQSYNGVNT